LPRKGELTMLVISEQEMLKNYLMKDAIKDLKSGMEAKRENLIHNPERTVINFPDKEGSALYMPSADIQKNKSSMKVVTIFPKNPHIGKPTTQGVLLLSDAQTGDHLCLMNASYLTRLRTGALSGVATETFARKNSSELAVVGTGAMAFEQVLGILEVRSISNIHLFNRTREKAFDFKEKLKAFGVSCEINVGMDVNQVIETADIICCATRSYEPVFDGTYLREGTHINGVGSFLPTMKEIDLTTIQKANKIIVDDLKGVKEEAGELIHAAELSDFRFSDIYAELYEVDGKTYKRETDQEITFFKSVGSAYFDQALAQGVYDLAMKKGFGKEINL